MKKLLLALFPLLLIGCSQGTPTSQDRMANPLYADQYWTDLTERMVNIQLQQEKDILNDKSKFAVVDETRRNALEKEHEANRTIRTGKSGNFVEVKQITQGAALLMSEKLFLSPAFATSPGPSLHVYLTTAVDPRDVTFPDDKSLDLGLLQSPYGIQDYALPKETDVSSFRTVTIYDTKLEWIYGFAQLQ